MEITGNKYLHKKFKKQTNCSPIYNRIENKNDSNVLIPVVNNNGIPCRDGGVVRSEPVNFLLFNKDNNKYVESVPNFNSTNCDRSLVTTDTDRCSQLDRDVNVVTLDNQSSISNVEVSVNVATQCNNNSSVTKELFYNNRRYRCNNDEPIEQQNFTSNVTNISTTTTTSLLGKDVRNFTFDNNTKINHSETATSTPKIVKSSILDTVYSKSNIISTTDRLINSSSSQSIIKPDESAKLEPNPPVTAPENNTTTEKKCPESSSSSSSTSGGKYVCTYCNLACSKPSVLQKHIRAHTNERPYPCVSCGFSFKTRSNLYKHCRSRTHANRVMGNKHHVQTNQTDAAASDSIDSSSEKTTEEKDELEPEEKSEKPTEPPEQWEQQKTKPYKPRFHTAKLFFEENNKPPKDLDLEKTANPDLLKSRINELIHKNNSIMNCDDAVVIRRRNIDTIAENNNSYFEPQTAPVHWQQPVVDYNNRTDEQPLNLTAKNRKRCLSDSDHTQKSLIKELLLKNLSTDPNLQCPYCKMIFQTVTELEMHKLKYCNAKTSNIRYARSSSVNVASILTQNKNAFDNIPHMQHTTFPLKSPGPCLGKTRLIENERHNSEKYRTFSFDDTVILHNTQSDAPSFNKYMLQSPVGTYPLSPQIKKNPVRLFGGEVKITQTSGETRSFKIESSESINKMDEQNFMDFRTSLSENFVIKSGLHSGGTVLQNKSNYSPKIDSLPSPNTIRMYDNTPEMSPNLLGDKFIFDKLPRQNEKLLNNNEQFKRGFPSQDKFENYDNGLRPDIINEKEQELYKSNLIDFGQKAVKMLAPNLKPPNLSIPGLPIPGHDKYSPMVPLEINITEDNNKMDKQHLENLNFAKKQINLQQRMAEVPQPQHVFNPMSLLVNGKVIPYVPGIPGPVVDAASDVIYNPIANRVKYPKEMPKSPISKYPAQKSPRPSEESRDKDLPPPSNGIKTPTIIVDHTESRQNFLNALPPRSDPVSRIAETKTTPSNLTVSSATSPSKEESRKFVRPTSLALKPTSCAFKSHHGLTPTMFNQALISPDTPRVAKKYCQQYLNGNYFSYLGLKSSTKSVYCTLNKTQPYYVKHFKKLSMYSEWRQQESKIDGLSVSAYDSRQRQNKYTMAGHAKADLIAHSSYKFVITESSSTKEENSNKSNSVLGGYESNEDYTYIRGRGRGRYVCDQCGIRCKKPSMLKKHIRTHSDDRPYTCEHCNFSFKTKGNLTKHMKSKAHSKKYAATSSTSARNSVTTSSDSEESDAESSDESTRLQEHEAAHCLLSLSQKNNQPIVNRSEEMNSSSVTSTYTSISNTTVSTLNLSELPNFLKDDKFLKNPDQITQVTNTNFVKNKILDEASCNFNIASKHLSEVFETAAASTNQENTNNVSQYLGKSATIRPLTYPYLQTNVEKHDDEYIPKEKYDETIPERPNIKENNLKIAIVKPQINNFMIQNVEGNLPTNIVYRKRKISTSSNIQYKLQRNEIPETKAVDLSVQVQEIPILDLSPTSTTSEHTSFNGQISRREEHHDNPDSHYSDRISDPVIVFNTQKPRLNSSSESSSSESFSQNSDTYDQVICKPILDTLDTSLSSEKSSFERKTPDFNEHDQSAMQTLAEIAIKQVKLEKNIMAKNVASEYLKLALNCDGNSTDGNLKKFAAGSKETVNDLIVKPEENKNCSICSKNFSKPSQLRLHMNIHYLERPFRCESCSVSFRTKGHLQKHERSASHHNKLSSSPALSSSEPRPFKCTDCNIAFRIHGHLAKHLRSKMHIMKLECSAKIPFGLYAELERANSLLTEINTTDGDLCLESLKILARKLFSNDPNKLDQLGNTADSQDS